MSIPEYLPDNEIVKLFYARDERALSETARKYGALFRSVANNLLQSVPDAEECENDTYLEASCTAIFTYCIAHAINQGWIDALAYGPVAQLGWHAVERSINDKGQVENVCVGTGMGFDPAFYAYRPVHVMAAHGYGPAIWAGAEIIRLLKNQHPKMKDSAVQFYPEEVPTNQPIFNYDGQIRF